MIRTASCALALLVGMAALWHAADSAQADQTGDTRPVLIKDFMFSPGLARTKVGMPVTWINEDDEPHTVVSGEGLFRSAALDTGMTYVFRFDERGTYHVFCSLHPQMMATIVVE